MTKTNIKLLSRLYKPTEGEILLNGVNIQDIDYNDYIKLVSVVFQDFALFDFTVAENIHLSAVRDDAAIKEALNAAGILDFVETLPGGMDRYLGKSYDVNGVQLSGGQQQKLAIARTSYKASKLIILDEPTASLDPKAETEVYENFNRLISGKTAIYISHRLSSCKFCDKIIFIDYGSIQEEGSHEELMSRNGKYAEMFNLQAQGYAV